MYAERIFIFARQHVSVIALLCCCLLALPRAEAAQPITIRVAMSETMVPISLKEDGAVTGMQKEMLQALFSLVPTLRPEFHTFPWGRAQALVEHGQMDLFVTYPSDSRKQYANFSQQPLFSLDYGNIVYDLSNRKAAQIAAARSFNDLKDMIFISQEAVAWEKENVPDYIQRYPVNGPPALMHMTFARKTGDFFIMPAEQAIYFATQLGYGGQLGMKKVSFIPNSVVSLHIGLRKNFRGNKELMATLESALQHPAFLAKKKAIEMKYRELMVASSPPKSPAPGPI